jgi:uncharacterized protein (DUF1015 family)
MLVSFIDDASPENFQMAQVYPFPAYRYNASRVSYDRVLTQPYDKISPAMQDKYYAADPHNLITVEKGRVQPGDTPPAVPNGPPVPNENNVYTRAAEALHDWIREQVVVQDTRPCFYSYTQEYTVPGTADASGMGERRTRRGFIGAGKLEEYSAGVVFRHEHTLSGPKADRLELLRHTGMHTGQLFLLYSDAERRIDTILAEAEAAAPPATELTDEYGVIHRLWVIWEPARIAAIHAAMSGQKLVIADGHHRYETALNFRNERRKRSAREQGLPDRAEAQDSTAAGTPPPGTSAATSALSVEHVEGAAASVATAIAASLATGIPAPGPASAGSIAMESARDGEGAASEALNAAPYEAAMMTFVNTRAEGLTILPTHRVVANLSDFSWPVVRRYLEPWFAAEVFSFTDAASKAEARGKFLHRLVAARATRAIGAYPAGEAGKGAFYVLTLRPGANLVELLPTVSPLQRELDVVLLHDGILEPALGITLQAATAEKNLTYEREAAAALDAVDCGAAQVSFLLNACSVEQVWEIATSGEVMPQKSTDFFPKLMSGITMYQV